MPAVSKSIRSSSLPSSTWSFGLKSNWRGVPDLRISRLSSSVRPRGASGCVRLGIRRRRRLQLALEAPELLLFVGDPGLERLALLDQDRSFLRIALLAGGLGDFVLAAADLFDALEQLPALAFELDCAVDILEDVGGRVPVAAVLFDRLGIGDHVLHVQHVDFLFNLTRALPAR